MALNLDAIGTVSEPVERAWTSKDALLYALAVGASTDPLDELEFTTENSRDLTQKVLPTFAVLLGGAGGGAMRTIGSFNPAMLVHAEQSIELAGPLAAAGSVTVTGRLVVIADKRSGALVSSESTAVDASGEVVFRTRSGMFIRGEGGFGAETGAGGAPPRAPAPEIPDRAPDHTVTYQTLPHQALLYRLCGDRNPLHSDPAFAAAGGFDRPILHGLCTYGFTGRALLHTLCGSDPARFRSMYGRFSRPVLPGQALTVTMWVDDDGGAASFRTSADGEVVLDRGRCTFA
jgi:acyl dehydratase